MNKLQILAAQAAIDKMISRGSFSICTIDKILEMTTGIPDKKDYQVLSLIHCVRFSDLPKELLEELPAIMQRVLTSESLNMEFEFKNEAMRLVQ